MERRRARPLHATRRSVLALAGAGLVAGLTAGLAGCGSRKGAGKPLVAVSIFPLFDLARRVAGERLAVELVLPPGRSEHSYDPTPKEVARFAKAKLAVSVGLGLDEWLERLVKGATGGVEVVRVGPKVGPRKYSAPEVGHAAHEPKQGGHEGHGHEGHGHEGHGHGSEDPHFWLDPVRTQLAITALAEAFAKLEPEGKSTFDANAATLRDKLAALHTSLDGRSKGWKRRTIVTFHGSMGYFAERYGLTVAAIIEPFPGKEPTAKYVAEVLSAIEQAKPAALFSEPQLDKRPAELVAREGKLPLFELDPIGGTAGADTYETLLEKNAAVLDAALS
jgi:zinc transport system substrate-binding protein